MMNALRLAAGFPVSMFAERTGLPIVAAERALAQAEARGLLERDHERIRPTTLGRRYLNDLLGLFLPEEGKGKVKTSLRRIKALTFDVFGTVVDWRGSLIEEGKRFGRRKKIKVDWVAFADAWRGGYRPAMDRVRRGDLPWTNIDGLHRIILDGLLTEFGIKGLTESDKDHLNRAWHRLAPWKEAVAGLKRLKKKYVIATLSNGNVALLTNMAKHGGLPWDCILSAELFAHYKPDPEAYQGAALLLGYAPGEVMMVAAHKDDLDAAAGAGLRTAFVQRPFEFGDPVKKDVAPEKRFDVNAKDFVDLARS